MGIAPPEWTECMKVAPYITRESTLTAQTLFCSLIPHLLLFSVQKDIGGKSSLGPEGIWELLNAITKWISVCGTSTGVCLEVLTDAIFYFKIQSGFIESKG